MSDVVPAVSLDDGARRAREIRPAATVMLLRDGGPPGSEQLEVLMLRRHPDAAFAANAWVFPGGAVDPGDGAVPVGPGPSDEQASRPMGLLSGGLAFWVAAARECFEEAGILLTRAGPFSEFEAARFARLRRELHAGERSFAALLRQESLALDLSSMHYISRWITPPGGTRRFDTRFFVAVAPPGQDACHDSAETVESVWTAPSAALARHAAGEIDLVYPTIKNLQALARYPTVAVLVASAGDISVPQTLPPRPLRPEPPCPS